MMTQERRRFPRLQGHFRVDVLNMGDDPNISPWESVIEAEALDISMQGMRVKACYSVPIGAILSVMVYFKGRESICLCEVVWRGDQKGGHTYGLYFKDWSKLDPLLEEGLAGLKNDVKTEPDQETFSVPPDFSAVPA